MADAIRLVSSNYGADNKAAYGLGLTYNATQDRFYACIAESGSNLRFYYAESDLSSGGPIGTAFTLLTHRRSWAATEDGDYIVVANTNASGNYEIHRLTISTETADMPQSWAGDVLATRNMRIGCVGVNAFVILYHGPTEKVHGTNYDRLYFRTYTPSTDTLGAETLVTGPTPAQAGQQFHFIIDESTGVIDMKGNYTQDRASFNTATGAGGGFDGTITYDQSTGLWTAWARPDAYPQGFVHNYNGGTEEFFKVGAGVVDRLDGWADTTIATETVTDAANNDNNLLHVDHANDEIWLSQASSITNMRWKKRSTGGTWDSAWTNDAVTLTGASSVNTGIANDARFFTIGGTKYLVRSVITNQAVGRGFHLVRMSLATGPAPIDTTDNLGLTDTISRVAVYDRSASDNLGLTDSITTELVAVRDVSDNLGLTDSVAAEPLLFHEETDGAGLSSDGYLTTVYNGGASENVAVTLDQAALRIAGDIDLRVELQAEQWRRASAPAQIPIANEGGTGTERGCFIYITNSATDPRVRLYWSADGTNLLFAESTVAIDTALADNQRGWLRATLDVNNGASGRDITFYTSTDGVSWSQLGSTITQGGVTSISAAVRNASLGDTTTSRSDIFGGRIYRGQIYDGIGGTLVWDADFSAVTAAEVAAGAFIENTGKTVEDSGASTWDVYSALNIEVGYGRDASDNLDLTDSFTQDITLDRSDSLGLTDALDPFAQTVDDTDDTGLTDTGKRVDFIGDISNDAIGLTDSFTAETFLGVDATDNLGLTDSAVFDVALDRQDDLDLTDATDPFGFTVDDSDNLGLTDSFTVEIGFARDYTDDLDLTDTASDDSGEAHSDDLDLTDVATWQADLDRDDPLGLTDSITVEFGEAVDATDTLGLTDSISFTQDFGPDVTDSLDLTDSDERVWDATRDLSDDLGLTDSFTTQFSGAGTLDASDNLGLTDSITVELTVTVDASDTLGLTDSFSLEIDTALDVTDDLGLSDSATFDTALTVDATDDLGLTDSFTVTRVVAVNVTDSLGLTDSFDSDETTTLNAADTLGLTDSFTRDAIAYVRDYSDNLGITESFFTGQIAIEGQRISVEASRGRVVAAGITIANSRKHRTRLTSREGR